MEPAEIAHKLAMISRLTAGELQGWHRYCTAWRAPFPGEMVALHQRAQRLGVTLARSSPAAPNGSTTAAGPGPTGSSGST